MSHANAAVSQLIEIHPRDDSSASATSRWRSRVKDLPVADASADTQQDRDQVMKNSFNR
jgi:predicted secreted protein